MKQNTARLCALYALWSLQLGLAAAHRAGWAAEPAQTARGAALAVACAACHGAHGNTADAARYPNLASQDSAYLVLQLKNFQSGERPNAIMKAYAASLSPAQMDDLAAYFSSSPAKPQKSRDAALEASGRAVFTSGSKSGAPACAACHGTKGQGQAVFPRIASQPAQYTLEQLHVYRDAASFKNPLATQMKDVAKKVSDDEMRAVAAYLATLN
jgi:cytochrome c553